MKRILAIFFILILMVSFSFSQKITVSIDSKKDTIVTKKKLEKLNSEVKRLKADKRQLEKRINKIEAMRIYRQVRQRIEAEKKKGIKRVYYVVCVKDTAKLIDKYTFFDKDKWNTSRASLDSLCRIIESKMTPKRIKEVKKAYKEGLVKEYGVWRNNMKRLYKYINNPKNGFIKKEEIESGQNFRVK